MKQDEPLKPSERKYDVPDWLADYVKLWIDRLELDSWHITLRLEHCINDDPFVNALTTQEPDLNGARIAFRADVEDTEWWRTTVVHELLHVKHSRIDHFLERAVFEELTTAEGKRIVQTGYCQQIESYTHEMAYILYKMWQWKEDNESPPPPQEKPKRHDRRR